MSERLVALARRLQARPWNRPLTEKAWVLHAMEQHRALERAVREARPSTTGPVSPAGGVGDG